MTPDELIHEGRELQRRSVLLTPEASGPLAAIWFGQDQEQLAQDGFRCWLTVDLAYVPPFDGVGWLSVFTDEASCQGGRVEFGSVPQKQSGQSLYAREISVLPPIDAVIARGSIAVERW